MADPSKKSAVQREIERWDRTVAAVIAASRRDADLTQKQLANKLAWTREMIVNVETGRRRLSTSELMVFGRVLGIDPEVLFRRIHRW